MKIWSLRVTYTSQYVRNGNTRFVLVGLPQVVGAPPEPARRYVVPAEVCSEAICELLAQVLPDDVVNLRFDEQDDHGITVRLFNEAHIHRPFPGGLALVET